MLTRQFLAQELTGKCHTRRLSIVRYHLNQEQKRVLIRDQLIDTPERTHRDIVSVLGVSYHAGD